MKEIPVDYLDQIRSAYPDLTFTKATLNQDGLVNDVIILDNAWVFRFPKDDYARESLHHETKILDLIRKYVHIPVPYFENHSNFVFYRMIPGEALSRERIFSLDEQIQDRLAGQLAQFLHELHSISADEAVKHGIRESDSVRTLEDWHTLYMNTEQKLFPLLMTHQKQWVQRHFGPVLDGSLSMEHLPSLIHGDLGPYHILFNPATNIIDGVIDFGIGGLGDPANDIAGIINGFGESFLRRMIGDYPEITKILDRARFWAGTLEIQWALGGLRTGDLSWFTVHIGRARDVLPYGARL